MLYYSLCFPVLAALFWTARQLRFDAKSVALMMMAGVLYYAQFYHSTWQEYAFDPQSHVDYITTIAEHHALPTPDFNSAAHHPPTYYIAAAILYSAAQFTDSEPMMAVRHLSMMLYLTFIVFSALFLRRLLVGKPYYLALSMLLFWPVGMTIGGRITCDVLLYAGQMGVLYFMMAWLQGRKLFDLAHAFLMAGVALLAKNSGIIFLGFCGALLLYALWKKRHNPKLLFSARLILSVAFAVACWVTTARWSWMQYAVPHSESLYTPQDWLYILTSFDPIAFLQETIFSDRQGIDFWDWFLRSLPLGQFFEFFYPPLAHSILFAFGVVWLCMLLYLLLGIATKKSWREHEKITWIALLFAACVMIASLMTMRVVMRDPAYADARYIYPMVTLILAGYGAIMQWHARAGRIFLVQIGGGVAAGFIMLSIMLCLLLHIRTAGLM